MDQPCDICGSTDLQELKCKVICRNCGTILRSCADLTAGGRLAGGGGSPRAPLLS